MIPECWWYLWDIREVTSTKRYGVEIEFVPHTHAVQNEPNLFVFVQMLGVELLRVGFEVGDLSRCNCQHLLVVVPAVLLDVVQKLICLVLFCLNVRPCEHTELWNNKTHHGLNTVKFRKHLILNAESAHLPAKQHLKSLVNLKASSEYNTYRDMVVQKHCNLHAWFVCQCAFITYRWGVRWELYGWGCTDEDCRGAPHRWH